MSLASRANIIQNIIFFDTETSICNDLARHSLFELESRIQKTETRQTKGMPGNRKYHVVANVNLEFPDKLIKTKRS